MLNDVRMRGRHFLTVSVLFAAFALSAGGATYLPSYQECAAQDEQRYTNTNGATSYQSITLFLRCEGMAVDANNGTLTAIGTILLAVITGWLVVVAREQSKTTRAQLRAYVFVTGKPEAHPDFSDETGVGIWLNIRNSGQTPAYKVRQWNTTDFIADPRKGPFPIPSLDKKFVEAAIGPNSDMPMRAYYPRARISDEKIAAVHAQKLTICIWGEITYEDAFDKPHYTRFRFFLPVESGGRVPGIQLCQEGNDAN